MLESGLVVLWGALIVVLTVRLVRHLDSLIVLCAWCHRARQDSTWTSIEAFLAAHSAEASHGMCPECSARFEADLAKAA